MPGVTHIIEVQLQAKEVTGKEALAHFADMLLNQGGGAAAAAAKAAGARGTGSAELYSDVTAAMKAKQESKIYPVGLQVEVFGLAKQQQFNGVSGVIKQYDEKNDRYGVVVQDLPSKMGVKKLLALRVANVRPKTGKLFEDPDMRRYTQDVRVWDAYKEVKKDPSKIRLYMDDPHVGPLLQDAAAKIVKYQKSCGADQLKSGGA